MKRVSENLYLLSGICILWFFFTGVLNFFEAMVILQLLSLNKKADGYVSSKKVKHTFHIKFKK